MGTQVYIGTSARTGGSISGVFRRDAAGGAWTHAIAGFADDTHVHAITVHPDDPAVVFAATSTGLYRSRDRGDRWTRLVEPAEGEQMWSVFIHPDDHRIILTGCAPLAVYRSDDGGETFRRMPRPALGERMVGCFPSRIMRMSVDGGSLYAGLEVNGAMRSDDGGESWVDCSDPLVALSRQPFYESAILSQDKAEGMLDVHAVCSIPGATFLALRMGLFRSTDKGASWQDLGIGRHAAHLRYGRDIVVAPWDATDLFAAVADSSRGVAGRLYRSRDSGATWQQIDHSVDVQSTMMAVALTGADRRQAHGVTRRGQTFSTLDDGGSWTDVGLPEGAGSAVAIACG
jgi:photosystem II stability/assembly factor-like uncharacterized protein